MVKSDLNRRVELYDPHPGFAGAAIPLPRPVKDVVDQLAGQMMSLEGAIRTLSVPANETGGKVENIAEHHYLGLRITQENGAIHFFRLLSYR